MTLAVLGVSGLAQAQSCSSEGVPRPTALLERFINADCAECWTDAATPRPARGEIAIDWVVPGSKGEDAPLSAVAKRDGLARLEALGRWVPPASDAVRGKALAKQPTIRVAHGLAFNGYIGAAIRFKPSATRRSRSWLLLVETLPAGTEGSPVERLLVRNAHMAEWSGWRAHGMVTESRPMSIPEGANPERLAVIGFVEDERGRIGGIAQSRCKEAR